MGNIHIVKLHISVQLSEFSQREHLCNQYPDLKTVISRTPECPLLLTPHKGNHDPGLTPCSSFAGFKI